VPGRAEGGTNPAALRLAAFVFEQRLAAETMDATMTDLISRYRLVLECWSSSIRAG
jgi:hypothetical protein